MILTISVDPTPVLNLHLAPQKNLYIVGTPGPVGPTGATGATGAAGATDAMRVNITQTAHAFVVGNVLRVQNNATTFLKAQANTAANAEVVGIVSSVTDSSHFVLTAFGYVTGLSGLTKGTVYFLSDTTAGLLTATEPVQDGVKVSKPIFIADSTTSGFFTNQRGVVNT